MKKKKVLVVEDELALCQSLKIIVEMLNIEVVDAVNGAQALQALQCHTFDLILCDINLPDISGYDILKKVKSNLEKATTPFIFLTAFADERDIQEGYRLGAEDYITKPFSTRDLLKMLKTRLVDTA